MLVGLGFMIGGGAPATAPYSKGLGAMMALSGFSMICIGVIAGAFTAAIGYVIELIAKIEWNTRPDTDEMRYTVGPVLGTGRMLSAKQYYYIDKGPLHGPLSAPEILGLYRDGKLSNSARYFVEENGQRRPLANLSEIGL